jgi:hypothetical protein
MFIWSMRNWQFFTEAVAGLTLASLAKFSREIHAGDFIH